MQNVGELKKQLESDGFVHIFEWKDEPGAVYEPHAHEGKVSMYILEGGLTMWFGEKEVILETGDRFDVPIGGEHTAKVGESGCHYLVGEMIEGDS